MSAKSLTKAAAKEAKIELVDGGRGSQAVQCVVVAMRAARRSGTANTKTKADVNLSGAKPWRQKVLVARGPVQIIGHLARRRCGLWTKARDYSKKVSKSIFSLLSASRSLLMRFATEVGAALPFLFAGVVAGVHSHHFLLKELLIACLI